MCSNQEKVKAESKHESDIRELKRDVANLKSMVTTLTDLCSYLEKYIKGATK